MSLTRRDWLGATFAGALSGALAVPRAWAQVTSDVGDPTIRFLAEWEDLGWHWTGTDVEAASAAWLGHRLSEIGARCETQAYRFSRTDVSKASLRVGERHIVGLPLFDAPSTPLAGTTGRLGHAGSNADIAVVEVAPDDPANATLAAARANARHHAVIVITMGGRPGLAPLDVAGQARGGAAVLQVSSAERDWLGAAAREGREATVTSLTEVNEGIGHNLVAAVTGTDHERTPIVIWVGRSGWGPCTGERGAALYCASIALAAVLRTPPSRGVVLAATSGEELGQLGLKAFLEHYPDLERHAYGWLRIGANVGTRGGSLSLDGVTSDWLGRLRHELRVDAVRFSGDPEAGAALATEGNGLTLSEAHGPLYHLPTDQLPAAIDVRQVNGIASALARTLVTLANT